LNTEFINGMGKVDEQFMILLNIDRIFNSEEMAWVQDAAHVDGSVVEDELVEA
jgi:purine-binding chemotaxis protein CheW